MRYDGIHTAGRLLAYCDDCREKYAARLGLLMPMSMFRMDEPRLLDLMYRGGATLSAPETVGEMFGVPIGDWAASAQRIIDGNGAAPSGEMQIGDWRGTIPEDRDRAVTRHRIAQGMWRFEMLQWPAGPPSTTASQWRYPTLPSILAYKHRGMDVAEAGVNLMSDAARGYARDRVPHVKALGGVVDRDRLYRNMLSSQPLAFSIAGELREHPQSAATVLAELTGRPIRGLARLEAPDALVPAQYRKPQTRSQGYQPLEAYALDGIEAEWFPPRWSHTNDKSGFDIATCTSCVDGTRLLISIEVKYVDAFSRQPLDWNRYRTPLVELGINQTTLTRLVEAGCSQVLRQVMITESIRRNGLVHGATNEGEVQEAISVVLAREDDETARRVVEVLREQLEVPIQFWSLRDLLLTAGRQEALGRWAAHMRRRYLCED